MYFSMGAMMWNWPLPSFLAENYMAQALIQLYLTVIIMVINKKFFISGFKSLWHRSPNMDTLVALGSSARLRVEQLRPVPDDHGGAGDGPDAYYAQRVLL